MSKRVVGVIIILILVLGVYTGVTGKTIFGETLSTTMRVILALCWLWFFHAVFISKTGKQGRLERHGASNFFKAMFSNKKDE